MQDWLEEKKALCTSAAQKKNSTTDCPSAKPWYNETKLTYFLNGWSLGRQLRGRPNRNQRPQGSSLHLVRLEGSNLLRSISYCRQLGRLKQAIEEKEGLMLHQDKVRPRASAVDSSETQGARVESFNATVRHGDDVEGLSHFLGKLASFPSEGKTLKTSY